MEMEYVGTSHISGQSVKDIRKKFEEFDPDFVAVELDRNRLYALLNDLKPSISPLQIRKIGVMGYLFGLIGGIVQKKLGSIVGSKPGVEMMAAIEEARKRKRHVFLIDQDLQVTLRNLSKISLREKLTLLKDIIISPFSKEKMNIDIARVPEKKLIKKLTDEMKKKYPGMYKALVRDRDEYMARAISKINSEKEGKLLVIIGAGHLEGTKRLVEIYL